VDRVRTALTDAAELLQTLHDGTIEMMNAGAPLDEILHAVHAPQHLLAKPYLKPIYDEPEFIVRNVWRLYGGWYDGNPAHLKPAPEAELAAEVAALAGGADRLAHRAHELAASGDLRLATHLAQLARDAAPGDAAIAEAAASVFRLRAESETSLMSKGIFNSAAEDSAG
jgi:alkyl sulfatase BDS1-like metallo-beta-lactamase superfamily hydrolase